jgi:hypothetical protein
MIRSLLGSLFVAFAIALAALALYVGRQERLTVEHALEEQLRRDAALLADLAPREAVGARDLAAVDAWADRIGRELEHRVTVIGADGAVLGDSRVDAAALPGVENHGDRVEVRGARARPGATGRALRRSETTGIE